VLVVFVEQFSRGEAARHFEPADFYELGLACWSSDGDLIEAHKWFNLAAMCGEAGAAAARADVADQMNAAEIAEAQRRARIYRQGRR
jgi:TPR repeat protein